MGQVLIFVSGLYVKMLTCGGLGLMYLQVKFKIDLSSSPVFCRFTFGTTFGMKYICLNCNYCGSGF